MQPVASYELRDCRPEYTKCSEVCPVGGHPKNHGGGEVSHPDRSCRVGKGELHLANLRRGLQQLARHCPDMDDSLRIPVENTERCISCGACEKLYPARPFSTIYVEGHERHRII